MENAKFFTRKNEEGKDQHCFCILNDFEDGYKKTEADEKRRKEYKLNEYFELFDDDDNKYYSGYLNSENLEELESDEFEVLDWGTGYAGCTYMKIRNKKTRKMEML